MFRSVITLLGILLALAGFLIAPEFLTREEKRRAYAIHRIFPDDRDNPWDLHGRVPVGWLDLRSIRPKHEWGWDPLLRRIK
jgi:hypothetical protein